MPQAIQYVATALANAAIATAEAAGVSEAVAVAIGTVSFYAAEAAISVGLSAAAAQAAMPTLPSPEAVRVPLNQSRPPVRWGVGRMRLSGPAALWDNVPGWAVESRLLCEGPVDGFEQVYLHDDKVTIKPNDFVATGTDGRYNLDLVQVFLRPGRTVEVPTPELVAVAGALWTTAHRNDGIAAVDMLVRAGKESDLSTTLPNGAPAVSVVTRLPAVFDWRDPTQSFDDPTTWKWSQNAVVCHLTWEWFGRYLGLAKEDYVTPNATQMAVWTRSFEPALSFWTTAADIADEIVHLKDGSTEARYVVGLMTYSTDAPDVIRRQFLDAYDGWMIRRSDGAWVVRAGKYVNPTFEVTDRNLIGITWDNGSEDSETVNVLEGGFLSTENDFSTQAIDPWFADDADGEIEARDTFDLPQVPSHGQARRLLKRKLYQRRAKYTGNLTLDLSGLQIGDGGHRWLRIALSRGPAALGNAIVEVNGDGDELSIDWNTLSVTVPVRSSGANIDSWTPAVEEGFKPNATDRTVPDIPLAPEILDAYAEFQSDSAALLVVKIENLHDPARTYQLAWANSLGTVDGPWSEANPVTGGLELRGGPVGIGDYYVQVRANIAGRITDWSNPPLEVLVTEAAAPYFPPKYSDGTDINDLKPAQAGADKTSEHTSADTANVSGVPASTVISNMETNALNALQAFMTALGVQDQLQGLMFVPGGKNIQLIVQETKTQTDNAASVLSVMGAMSMDGSAFVFNGSGVKIGSQTIAEVFSGIQTSLDGNTASIVEQATAIDGLLARWQISVNNSTGAISGILLEAVGTLGHMDFVSGVIRFVTTSTSADPKVPFIISGSKVVCTVDFEVDGNFLALGSVDTPAVTDHAITEFVSTDTGSISNLSSETTIATVVINPKGALVRLNFRALVDNPSSTEIAVRIKLKRNGTQISPSLGTKLNTNFPTNYVDYFDDTAGYTSAVTYTLTAQTVTGTDIGDTGGTGINRNLFSANLTAELKKK